jgi:hypothetical protein
MNLYAHHLHNMIDSASLSIRYVYSVGMPFFYVDDNMEYCCQLKT